MDLEGDVHVKFASNFVRIFEFSQKYFNLLGFLRKNPNSPPKFFLYKKFQNPPSKNFWLCTLCRVFKNFI